ncbi:MAG: hypothetical protein ABH885_03280 [Candidatus Omnitrophota bacterium]
MRFVKSVVVIFFAVAFVGMLVVVARGGDILIAYLSKSMGLEVSYSNWVGGIDALLFREGIMDNVDVRIMNTPIRVKSAKAYISFDYGLIVREGTIFLECTLHDAAILVTAERANTGFGVIDTLPSALSSVSEDLANTKYDKIICGIALYKDTVDLRQLDIFSKEVVFSVNGIMTKGGDINGHVRACVSPVLMKVFGPHIAAMMPVNDAGWGVFDVNLAVDGLKKSIDIEGETIKFHIGRDVEE